MSLAILAALFLSAAPLTPADATSLDTTVAAIFAPYKDPEMASAPWERPIFSREVTRLIDHWQSVVPEDEVDYLNDGDWLCQCQDWDAKSFKVKIKSRKPVEPEVAEVIVNVDLGFGVPRDAFLRLRREEGKWLIDDLFSEGFPDGIKQALRETIKDDEALREGRQ